MTPSWHSRGIFYPYGVDDVDRGEAMTDDCYTEERDGYEGPDDDEVRYGLTALGVAVLEECPGFSGFGPCAASRPVRDVVPEAKPALRGLARTRKRRSTPLFG